jgi:hypothetical protein
MVDSKEVPHSTRTGSWTLVPSKGNHVMKVVCRIHDCSLTFVLVCSLTGSPSSPCPGVYRLGLRAETNPMEQPRCGLPVREAWRMDPHLPPSREIATMTKGEKMKSELQRAHQLVSGEGSRASSGTFPNQFQPVPRDNDRNEQSLCRFDSDPARTLLRCR